MLGNYTIHTPYALLGQTEAEIKEDRKRALKVFLSISLPGLAIWYWYYLNRKRR